MPSVNFIGTIDHASGGDAEVVSLTWEILPGSCSSSSAGCFVPSVLIF